jgi:hypothetical protein
MEQIRLVKRKSKFPSGREQESATEIAAKIVVNGHPDHFMII